MSQTQIALCTAPDASVAERLAKGLLEARLAACVNLVPGIQSHYWWQGQMECAAEVLMIIKTTADRIAELKGFMASHHGYEVPELLIVPADDGLSPYLRWIEKETRR